MTPAQAKKIADRANYHFYWDSSQQMYACYPHDMSEEASYHSKRTLASMDEALFVERYITAGKPRIED